MYQEGYINDKFNNFIDSYVFAVDFTKPDKILYNKILGGVHCWWELFPDAVMANYFVDVKKEQTMNSPEQPEYYRWDLHLFFEEYNKKWYLVCVIGYGNKFGWAGNI